MVDRNWDYCTRVLASKKQNPTQKKRRAKAVLGVGEMMELRVMISSCLLSTIHHEYCRGVTNTSIILPLTRKPHTVSSTQLSSNSSRFKSLGPQQPTTEPELPTSSPRKEKVYTISLHSLLQPLTKMLCMIHLSPLTDSEPGQRPHETYTPPPWCQSHTAARPEEEEELFAGGTGGWDTFTLLHATFPDAGSYGNLL